MIATTEKYKSDLYNAVSDNLHGTLNLINGDKITLNNDNIVSNTLALKEQCTNSNQFNVGGAVVDEINIGLVLDTSTQFVLTGATFDLAMTLTFDDDTTQELPIGIFHVDGSTVKRTVGKVSFTAYNKMILFDKEFTGEIKSKTPYYIINNMCSLCGVSLATTSSVISSMANGTSSLTFVAKENKVYNCRDILSFVCEILGAFARVNRLGKLEIIKFETVVDKVLDENNCINRTVSDDKIQVTGIKCGNITTGANGYQLDFSNNPFLNQNQPSEVGLKITQTLNQIKNIEFYNATIDWFGDLSLQAGDCISYQQSNLFGGTRKLIVMSSTWSYRGKCKIQSFGDVNSSGYSPINKQAQAIDNTLNYIKVNYLTANTIEATYITSDEVETYYLKATQADIKYATIENLNATKADITEINTVKLTAITADIDSLQADKANISDLTVAVGNISNLQSSVANITSIISGSIGTGSLQTISLTAQNAVVSDAFAKSLIATKITVADLLAGDISTNRFRIVSNSGKLLISDNTMQISDSNRVRVQIGKDADNDYNMYVWDSTGKLMFDALGLKADGIKSAIIRNDMVSDTANISGSKLDINSVITAVNGATTTIKASKVSLDTTAQTLDVAFSSLATTVTNEQTKTSALQTSMSMVQGQITSKIWQSDITTAVDNVVVGGRNLLIGTDVERTLTRSSANVWYDYEFSPNLLDTETSDFVFSVLAKGNASSLYADFYFKSDTAVLSVQDAMFNVSTIYNRYTVKAHLNTSVSLITICRIRFYSGSGTITFKQAKLERGNKATDWTPAPEDTQSQITTLTTQYNAVSDTVSSHTQTIANIQTTATATDSKISALTLDLNGFKTTVSDTYATQTELQSAESSISQQATEISLKVSKNGVISAINQSAETVGISAGKINIAGLLTAINGNTTTTINGNKITTGTITADKLSVTDLSALNATMGGFTISDKYLYAYREDVGYTTIKNDAGDVAMAFGSPSYNSSADCNLQIFHDGRLRSGSSTVAMTIIDKGAISIYYNNTKLLDITPKQRSATLKELIFTLSDALCFGSATSTYYKLAISDAQVSETGNYRHEFTGHAKFANNVNVAGTLYAGTISNTTTVSIGSYYTCFISDTASATSGCRHWFSGHVKMANNLNVAGTTYCSNISTSGNILLGNNYAVRADTSGGTTVDMVKITSSNEVTLGNSTTTTLVTGTTTTINASNSVKISGLYTCFVNDSSATASGCRHWFSGHVKMANNLYVAGTTNCDAVNASDITISNNCAVKAYATTGTSYNLIGINAANNIVIGNGGQPGYTNIYTSAITNFVVGSSIICNINGSGINMSSNTDVMLNGLTALTYLSSAICVGTTNTPLKLRGSSVTSNGSTVTSDARQKCDIQPLSDKYTSMLDLLQAKSYRYTAYRTGTTNCGFVAQDVLQVLSDLGMSTDDFGGFVDIYGDGREYALDYAQFVPILWAICKDLKNQILKNQIKELKS